MPRRRATAVPPKPVSLPRGWRYLDIGMVIGITLVIAGLLIEIIALTGYEGKTTIVGPVFAMLGVILTIAVGYLGTRTIKAELH